MEMIFKNREQAGQMLGRALLRYHTDGDVTVLGLSRGGVPVAAQVARALNAPLDVMVVRKIGAPWNPEVALGALASGGELVLNRAAIRAVGASAAEMDALVAREEDELRRRERLYRRTSSDLRVDGHTVILVDDGLATGYTMLAAVRAVRRIGSGRVIVAAPVGARAAVGMLMQEADEVECLSMPRVFRAVGYHYEEFPPVSDEEVVQCLKQGLSNNLNHL